MDYLDLDYDGPMEYFTKQLEKAGVPKEEFDITNYVGCTERELQGLVNWAIRNHSLKLLKEGVTNG